MKIAVAKVKADALRGEFIRAMERGDSSAMFDAFEELRAAVEALPSPEEIGHRSWVAIQASKWAEAVRVRKIDQEFPSLHLLPAWLDGVAHGDQGDNWQGVYEFAQVYLLLIRKHNVTDAWPALVGLCAFLAGFQ